jgi:hypothetical protein
VMHKTQGTRATPLYCQTDLQYTYELQ